MTTDITCSKKLYQYTARIIFYSLVCCIKRPHGFLPRSFPRTVLPLYNILKSNDSGQSLFYPSSQNYLSTKFTFHPSSQNCFNGKRIITLINCFTVTKWKHQEKSLQDSLVLTWINV